MMLRAELLEQASMRAMCHDFSGTMKEGEVYHHRFHEHACGLFCRTDLLFVNRLMIATADALTEALIDEAHAFYRDKGAARFMLHVCPHNFTDDHREMLERKGGRGIGRWVKHMKVPSRPADGESAVFVRPARQEEHARIGEILLAAFGWPVPLLRFCQEGLAKRGWKAYVAVLDNELVATGSIFIEDEVAALGIGATLPSAQRHGAQGALIRARERDALEGNCRFIFSETIEPTENNPAPSFRNMQRYGFSELYRRANYLFELL